MQIMAIIQDKCIDLSEGAWSMQTGMKIQWAVSLEKGPNAIEFISGFQRSDSLLVFMISYTLHPYNVGIYNVKHLKAEWKGDFLMAEPTELALNRPDLFNKLANV